MQKGMLRMLDNMIKFFKHVQAIQWASGYAKHGVPTKYGWNWDSVSHNWQVW
jgi:hypothetical protein